MGRFVIVAYKPKPGKQQELAAAVEKHLRVLREEKLVTDKPAHVMRAADGTMIEVFEWLSAEAIAKAHANLAVQALWGEFAAVCDYVPLASLAEAGQMFAEFEATIAPIEAEERRPSIDWDAIDRFRQTLPMSKISAVDLVRRMRDEDD